MPLSSIYQSVRSAAAGGFGFKRRRSEIRSSSLIDEPRLPPRSAPTQYVKTASLAPSFLPPPELRNGMYDAAFTQFYDGSSREGGGTLDASNSWAFLPSFGLIRIFKNLGGFEFLGSMSFNQTELQRPPPESSGEWVTSRQVRRRRQGGFNPREEKRGKRLKLHRPSTAAGNPGKIAASIASRM